MWELSDKDFWRAGFSPQWFLPRERTREYEDVDAHALDDFMAEKSLIQRAVSLGHYKLIYCI